MPHNVKFNRIFILVSFLFLFTAAASAHCDSMDGPVVKASIKALETGNINYVFIWIKPENEKEIQDIFERVLIVRKLSGQARELADNYFYETVVRIHRMGEGAAYTGIKPAGYKPEEGIMDADMAVTNNSINTILNHTGEKERIKVKELFNEVISKKNYDINDVESGRDYVASYIHFIHYVEKLYSGTTEEHHDL